MSSAQNRMERYRVLAELGDGAFGTVLKAELIETGEPVAVKRLKKQYNTWDECLALREVQSLTKLKHVNIIRCVLLPRRSRLHCALLGKLFIGNVAVCFRVRTQAEGAGS